MAAGAIAGAVAGAVQGIADTGVNIWNAYQQYKTQKETWKRDDTAVQRRVKDLVAAGLSPTLAAGSAASNTVTSAPSLEKTDFIAKVQASNAIRQQQIDYAISQEQKKYLATQRIGQEEINKGLQEDNRIKAYDNDLIIKSGLPSNASTQGKWFREIQSALENNTVTPTINAAIDTALENLSNAPKTTIRALETAKNNLLEPANKLKQKYNDWLSNRVAEKAAKKAAKQRAKENKANAKAARKSAKNHYVPPANITNDPRF